MMMMITALPLLLVCALADDADFVAAGAALDAFDYEAAVTRFEAVVKKPHLSAQDRATAQVWLGVACAETNDEQRAVASFEEALSLDPWVGLPPNSSPTIRTMFDTARERARTRTRSQDSSSPPLATPAALSPTPVKGGARAATAPTAPTGADAEQASHEEPSSLLPVGIGAVSVGGVISVVAGATWGVGLALHAQGEASEFQSDAKELDDQSSAAQVVGQIGVAVGVLTLAGGGVVLGIALLE